MLNKLREWAQATFAPVSPAFRERLARIDAWLAILPLDRAQEAATSLIANPEWFDSQLAIPGTTLPEGLPLNVQDFYARFSTVRGRFCDLAFEAGNIAISDVDGRMVRIGWSDGNVEMCCLGADPTIHYMATDVPSTLAQEGTQPSLYHAILRTCAILEYVAVPSAAV